MPDLQIKIQTLAELAGAKQVEQGLERDIGKAKALGQDFSALETQLQSVRKVIQEYEADVKKAADANAAFAAEIKRLEDHEAEQAAKLKEFIALKKQEAAANLEAARAASGVSLESLKNNVAESASTEKLSLKKAELKKLVKEIGHEFPILGSLGRLAMNPIAAGASLAVVSVTQLFVSFKRLNDFFKQFEGPEERVNLLTERLDAQRQVVTDAAIEQQHFARSLHETASAADILKQRTEDSIAAIKKLQAAEDEKANRKSAIEKLQVEKDLADGKIDNIAAMKKKQEIDDRYQREAIARANAAQQKQIDAKIAELAELKDIQLDQATKKKDAARDTATKSNLAVANAQNDVDSETARREITQRQNAAAKEQLKRIFDQYNVSSVEEFKDKSFTMGSGIDMEAKKVEAEQLDTMIKSSDELLKKHEALIKKRKEAAAKLRVEADAANAELKAAEDAVKKAKDSIDRLNKEIGKDESELSQDSKNREEIFNLDKTQRSMQTEIGVSAEKKKEADAAEREKQNQSRAINSNKFSAVSPDSAPLVAAVENMPSAVPLLEDVVSLLQKQNADHARKFQEIHQRINDSFNV